MHSIEIGDTAIHYRHVVAVNGAPTVVFINSLGTDFRLWDGVVSGLDTGTGHLSYDKRGHGLSGIGRTPYSIAQLAGDLADLMDRLGIENAIICGVSVGGQIAQQLYHDRPNLVAGLMLCDTAAKIGDRDFWQQRIDTIARDGLAAVAEGVMARWFSGTFRENRAADYAVARAMFERQPVAGYLATCAAIAAFDRRADTGKIGVPVSVVAGAEDGATPPDLVESFAHSIPGAEFEIIEGAGHLPSIETPGAVTAALKALIARVMTKEDAR